MSRGTIGFSKKLKTAVQGTNRGGARGYGLLKAAVRVRFWANLGGTMF